MMDPRIACVIGGTSGIGRAVSLSLLSANCQVLVVGKGETHANAFREELEGLGYSAHARIEVADLRSPAEAKRLAEDLEASWGRLDVLVNAAGSISAGGIELESFGEWERVLTTNLHPMFLTAKLFLPLLKKGYDPNIINISSVCSLRPCSSLSYSVSKAGVDMFTKVLAKELAQYRIRVNAVNPGVVRSNLQISAGMFSDESTYSEWMDRMTALHPLGRVGDPEDVASAVMFLASPGAIWITGAILSVDGGRAIA